MNSVEKLPRGYEEIYQMDLQNNKQQMFLVNALALLIVAAMAAPLFIGKNRELLLEFFHLSRMAAFFVGVIVYLLLHELVHGIFMHRFGRLKPKYGFTGMYAYAGSEAYFCRRHYIIIGLSPIVIWGVVLAVLQITVPASWALTVYWIQITNISGAAGDLYVTWKMLRMPPDILVRDSGVAMTVYSREGKKT